MGKKKCFTEKEIGKILDKRFIINVEDFTISLDTSYQDLKLDIKEGKDSIINLLANYNTNIINEMRENNKNIGEINNKIDKLLENNKELNNKIDKLLNK